MGDATPPSFSFAIAAAAIPAAAWCCFLPLVSLLWWLPASIVASYGKEMLPDSLPIESALHLYAAYSAIVDAEWERWWAIMFGTLLLQKAMGLSHEAIWDAFEPFIIGRPGHGVGTTKKVFLPKSTPGRERDVLDKDGNPLGAQTVLAPGTQIRVDAHDGRGFQPFIIPGTPTFSNERKAIEAFFTKQELDALHAAGVRPWDSGAQNILQASRVKSIRDEYGLWKSS